MNDFCAQKKIKKTIKISEGIEEEFTFHAIPFGTVLKMRSLGKSVSKLLATALSDTSKDVTVETLTRASENTDAEGNAYVDQHTTQKEISASLAALRHKQFMEAIEGLSDTLLSDDLKDIAAEIVIKSCKDKFSMSDMGEFADKMPPDLLIKLLAGAFEASAGGLQDLGKFLSPQLKDKLQKAGGVVKENLENKTK